MFNNGLFSSSLSTSNPFSLNGNNSGNNLDNSIMEAYAKLDMLKQQQNQLNGLQQPVQQKSTAFTDIAEELKNMSEDEMQYITNSKEYIEAFNKYQTQFSEFLTSKFANEFLQSGNGRSVEELLFVIRQKKEAYKGKFAKDITDIQEQNKALASTNNELLQSNAKLQQQLEEIQRKLMSR